MTPSLGSHRIAAEPYYQPAGNECVLFEAAAAQRLPLLLRGPTGCGKTRFVQHMAWRLERPLITIACNEDTRAADLTGRWLLDASGTRWQDGPLTLGVRQGAICYLAPVVDARAETLGVIHPLAGTRRLLPLEGRSEALHAHPDFLLVLSHDPVAGPAQRDLKPATRQRFCALRFGYPTTEHEVAIVARESGVDVDLAVQIVALGIRTRRLQGHGLEEGASTRMLVRAAQLVAAGVALAAACRMAIVEPLSDEPEVAAALQATVAASF